MLPIYTDNKLLCGISLADTTAKLLSFCVTM